MEVTSYCEVLLYSSSLRNFRLRKLERQSRGGRNLPVVGDPGKPGLTSGGLLLTRRCWGADTRALAQLLGKRVELQRLTFTASLLGGFCARQTFRLVGWQKN